MQKKSILTLWALLLSALLLAQEEQTSKVVIDQILAVVGDNIILESDIEAQYLQMKAQGISTDSETKCKIFEEKLFQKLLVNQAAIDSVEVSEKEVEADLQSRMDGFKARMGGSNAKLEEYFGKTIFEIKNEFRDIIRDQLITRRMQGEIAGDIAISPSEVRKYFNNTPKDSLPLVPESIEYLQISLIPKVGKDAKKEVKDRLNGYRKRIVDGERFETIAVLYSQDGTATNGGNLGFVNRMDLVPEFSTVAFNMEPGDISEIVETEFGYHLIKPIERRGEQINVSHILLKPEVSRESLIDARNKLDSIKAVIEKDTLTFKDAALRYSDDKDSRANGGLVVNPYTGSSKFETTHIEPSTNYMLKTMKAGEISKPFESTDQRGSKVYKIIMLKSRNKPHVANLKDDYNQIMEMALAQKKQNEVIRWVKEKQQENYIRIEQKYRDCNWEYPGWVK